MNPLCTWVQVKLDAVPRLPQKWGHMWYSCFLKVLVEAATAQLSSPQMLRGFCWFSLTLGFHLKVVQPWCLLMSDSLSYLLRLCLFFAWFSSPGSPSLLLDPQSHATQCITPLSGSPLWPSQRHGKGGATAWSSLVRFCPGPPPSPLS